MKYLFLLVWMISAAEAFTLNNNFGASFQNSKVKVYVANETQCADAGMTVYELQDLVKLAVDNFWNEVSTSSLRLETAGFYPTFPVNINTAVLCSPTDLNCINVTASGKELIPPVKDIVIACNEENRNFNGSASVLAVAVPNNFGGKNIKGAVILINNGPAFLKLSRSDKISVIAHEIGHAIGLGHALNKNPEALMYFKTVDLRTNLAQDDVDGVTYLYPKQMDGCGLFNGFGGSIISGSKGPPYWQMLLMLALMMMLSELLRFWKKARLKPLT